MSVNICFRAKHASEFIPLNLKDSWGTLTSQWVVGGAGRAYPPFVDSGVTALAEWSSPHTASPKSLALIEKISSLRAQGVTSADIVADFFRNRRFPLSSEAPNEVFPIGN